MCSTGSATIVKDNLQHVHFTYSGKETAFKRSALDKASEKTSLVSSRLVLFRSFMGGL